MKISVINDYYCDENDQFRFMKDLGFDGCDFKMGRYFEKNGVYSDIFSVTPKQIKEHFSELKKPLLADRCTATRVRRMR